MQQFVDFFSFAKSGNSTILPVDRADITGNSFQCTVAAHQCFKAECQSFFQKLPEIFLIFLGKNTDLRKVQADNTLVKSSFKLIIAVFVFPWSQKTTAAHTTKHISFVIFPHFLGRNIIRIHSLGRTLYRQFCYIIVFATFQCIVFIQHIDQFWKCRCHINTFFIFDSFQTLSQDFFYDHGIFFYVLVFRIQVQKQSHKRRLAIGSHQRVDLILNSLNSGF